MSYWNYNIGYHCIATPKKGYKENYRYIINPTNHQLKDFYASLLSWNFT